MHEDVKLAEARYFLAKLRSTEDPQAFAFELSAFFSASRSALQYALEDARRLKGQAAGDAWFADRMKTGKEMEFFRDKRNLSIHYGPVRPDVTDTRMTIPTAHMNFESDLGMVVTRAPGTTETPKPEFKEARAPRTQPTEDKGSTTRVFRFNEWPNENILDVCDRYLVLVEQAVAHGRAHGFVSP